MSDDLHRLHQVRKALNDIQESFIAGNARKAEYQFHLLRTMLDASNPQPWSYYRPRVAEEFGE